MTASTAVDVGPTVLVTAAAWASEAQRVVEDETGARVECMDGPIDAARLAARLASDPPVVALVLRGSPPLDAAVLGAARHLKVVAKNGAGIDSVDLAEADRRGIVVAVAAGGNADAVAEHALAMMLALMRDLPGLDRRVRVGPAAVGIVGYGAIGRATARLVAALGGRVVVLRRDGSPADGFAVERELDALLGRVDVLSLHCPLTEATRGLIDARRLALMRPGSFLINTARGPVVDEAALVDALRDGHLAGAGLDTFATEPLPADSPLRRVEHVILTPHVAGVTRNAAIRVATMTARNVTDALADRPLPHANRVVAPSTGRR